MKVKIRVWVRMGVKGEGGVRVRVRVAWECGVGQRRLTAQHA